MQTKKIQTKQSSISLNDLSKQKMSQQQFTSSYNSALNRFDGKNEPTKYSYLAEALEDSRSDISLHTIETDIKKNIIKDVEMEIKIDESVPKEEVKKFLETKELIDKDVSEMTYDKINMNLLQLTQIKNNDRLMIDFDKKIINIDTRSMLGIKRFFTGNGRDIELHFIKLLINKAILYCRNISENKKSTITSVRELQNLLVGLQGAKGGLHRLKTTYINDNAFQSEIDIITAKIETTNNDCQLNMIKNN